MSDKRSQISVEYLGIPRWGAEGMDSVEGFDVPEVTLVRRTTVYPVTKAGSVQWSQGERTDEELMTVPTHHLPDVIHALLGDVAWVASGKARKESMG